MLSCITSFHALSVPFFVALAIQGSSCFNVPSTSLSALPRAPSNSRMASFNSIPVLFLNISSCLFKDSLSVVVFEFFNACFTLIIAFLFTSPIWSATAFNGKALK